LGYVRFPDWKLYGEEALARREAAVWLQPGSLTLEYGLDTLSLYDGRALAGDRQADGGWGR
jgi:hypothetical protein